MLKLFSLTQKSYFRRQSDLIGNSDANYGKYVTQRTSWFGPKAKLQEKQSTKGEQATSERNRHHAYKILATGIPGSVQKAAYVVLNTPTGRIDKAYAKAVRELGEFEQDRADEKKSAKAERSVQNAKTPEQRDAATAIKCEKMAVKIKMKQQERLNARSEKISDVSRARRTNHMTKFRELKIAAVAVPAKQKAEETIRSLEQMLDESEVDSSESPDSLVVFVNTTASSSNDESASESLV